MEFYWDIELNYQNCKTTTVAIIIIIILLLLYISFRFKYSGQNYLMKTILKICKFLWGLHQRTFIETGGSDQSTWLESGSWSQCPTPQLKKDGLSLLMIP